MDKRKEGRKERIELQVKVTQGRILLYLCFNGRTNGGRESLLASPAFPARVARRN